MIQRGLDPGRALSRMDFRHVPPLHLQPEGSPPSPRWSLFPLCTLLRRHILGTARRPVTSRAFHLPGAYRERESEIYFPGA